MTLAPEIEGGIELVAELVSRGWVASIGHTRAAVEVLDRAFAAGARHMTHFMNAMAPFNHRSPGPVGWGLAREDATCDIIADGIHLDPFVLRLLMKAKGADRLLLISDAIAAAGKGDGEYSIWGETIAVKDRRTSNSRGSIAGSVITMLDAARMMLSLGASEPDVARMAATNPSRLLRLDHDGGAIQEGKRADLVALDPDGKLHLTVIGGGIAFQRHSPTQIIVLLIHTLAFSQVIDKAFRVTRNSLNVTFRASSCSTAAPEIPKPKKRRQSAWVRRPALAAGKR